MEQVRKTEKSVLNIGDSYDNVLVYDLVIPHLNLKTQVAYAFADNKLVAIAYRSSNFHGTNSNLYISDYENVQQFLIKKYHEPFVYKLSGLDEHDLKNNKEALGAALSNGDLAIYTAWKISGTWIEHTTEPCTWRERRGEGYEIDHRVTFRSIKLWHLADDHGYVGGGLELYMQQIDIQDWGD